MRVFLGGTTNDSTWRDKFAKHVTCETFNPVVDDWNEEAQQRELEERRTADYVLYVITPKMTGVYSIAEVVDDSNKRPDKTILVVLFQDGEKYFSEDQQKSLEAVKLMVAGNGAKVLPSLGEAAHFLNSENKQRLPIESSDEQPQTS